MNKTISSFLQYLEYEKRYAKNTIQSYKNDLNQYDLYLRTTYNLTSLQDAQHIHIRSWIVNMLGKAVSSTTIQRKLSALKSFYKYALKHQLLVINPMNKVLVPKAPKRLPTFLTQNNMNALFQNVEFGGDYVGIRDQMILEILYATGMRKAELIGLQLTDVDTQKCRFRVLGKGNKERMIPFSAKLNDQIIHYINKRNDTFELISTQHLFLTEKGKKLYPKAVYNIVKKYLSQITTQAQRSPHTLRHTFATHLLDEGAGLEAVQKILGHASLASTQIYTHNSIEKLKRSYQAAHPKA